VTLPQLPPRELAAQLRADMDTIALALEENTYSYAERCVFRREYLRLARQANDLVRQAILDERRVAHA
jgi:hypothetical protein